MLDRYYDLLPYTVNQPYILPTLPSVNALESQPPLDMRTLFPAPLPIGQRQFAPPYCLAPATSSTDPATGNYHALTAKLEQRFSYGLQLLTAFTWSKTIDDVSEIQTQSGDVKNVPQYPYR